MGKVSNSALKKGSEVIGVIPEFLKIDENINYNISEIIEVKSMAERKKILFDKGDAFLILPGGSGTIEEATEVISWKFLELHNKPIIIFYIPIGMALKNKNERKIWIWSQILITTL